MTNDKLNKLVERFINIEEALSKLLLMSCELAERDKQLIEIIKMQKEALNYYSDEYDWRGHWFRSPIAIRHRDDSTLPEEFLGYQKARTTTKAVNEKLKEMGIEI